MRPNPVFFAAVWFSAFGQSVTMSLTSTSGVPGSTVPLNLQINAPAGSSPSAVEWTINAPVPDVQSITAAAGPVATAASKSISCSGNTCVISGLNNMPIANGTVATLNVQLSATASGNLAIQLSNVSAASVSAGGIPLTLTNGVISVLTPALGISKTHSGSFTQGQANASYTVTVSNGSGAGPTSGTVTVTETVPSGLTLVSMSGTGWTCPGTLANNCTRSDALNGGASYPAITVKVNVASNATSPQVNSVSVAGGGSATASTTDSTTITANPPVLSISKTHSGSFTQGQANASYTVTVSNGSSAGPTSGTVTVTETVPSGLTLVSMSGTGWTCPGTLANNCTRSDALNGGASYPAITVKVNVASNATSPQVNSVSVSGGGSATASTTDSTTITANPPVLSIAKTHSGSFTQGQANASYTVTVSNGIGAGPTSGTVTVTETVPSGLTLVSMSGSGWTCPGTLANNCTRSDVLNAAASYPAITVMVNVASNATSPQVNSVAVSGGGSATTSTTDSTNITANPPVLSIAKTHSGSFTQGQANASYTVTVSNGSSAGPTSGTVTVTETVPSGLTLVSMSGSGWTCPGTLANNCTRNDALNGGASYPAITVKVNVASNATSPQVNSVSVAGGGSATASTTDSTTITANPPVLSISKTHSGSFTQGQANAS